MKPAPGPSIYRRLVVGLIAVAVTSSVLLLFSVFLDYHFGFADLTTGEAATQAWHEVFEHVLVPALLFIAPTAFAFVLVVRNALSPLERAARRMEATRGSERGFRLSLAKFPREAQPFAVALNDLLERLDAAATQQEAFAADVAHELRTPLALARLELAETGGGVKHRLQAELLAMQRLIDQLLLLSQIKAADAARMPRGMQDLAAIGQDCVAALAPLAIAGGKEIAFEAAADVAPAAGWREAIQAGLRNLVENALRVTPAGGTVQVIAGPGACLRVRDQGPGLSREQLDRLIHRHARAENASRSGAGLGLSIVDQIMRAHCGTLSTVPGERELRLDFPAAERSAAA